VIVVDATVLIDLLVATGELSSRAAKLAAQDPDWISPSIWRYEFGNAVRNMVRGKHFQAENVPPVWGIAEASLIETELSVDQASIYSITEKHGLSFYDASYVHLARSRALKLYTRDKQVLRECADVARSMPEL
jgi:predicted nucleic acid-binding protein